MSHLPALRVKIRRAANPTRARISAGYFKTGKGEYGEGDIFVGLTVPESRTIAKEFCDLPVSDIKKLLASKIHEERLIALLILVDRFARGTPTEQERTHRFYLSSLARINNWDLVDTSAAQIVGEYLYKSKKGIAPLEKLAQSENLWRRRVAIIATHAFVRANDFTPTFRIADMLLRDSHDLIHKAVGWMLREAGNRSRVKEEAFLKTRYKRMPRTMLRYAIERFPEARRKQYLLGKV